MSTCPCLRISAGSLRTELPPSKGNQSYIPLQLVDRSLAAYVPGVQRALGLEQKDVRLLVRNGQMIHPLRHNKEFAGIDLYVAVAQPNPQAPLHHEKHLVFIFMMMPDELPLHFGQLHVAVVEFANNLRAPVVREAGKFFGEVYLVEVHTD